MKKVLVTVSIGISKYRCLDYSQLTTGEEQIMLYVQEVGYKKESDNLKPTLASGYNEESSGHCFYWDIKI